jgi:endonuclease III
MSATHKMAQKFPTLIEADWSVIPRNEWELLTGVILDTRTPIERLRIVCQKLKDVELLDFRELCKLPRKEVEAELRWAGYPWARQKSKCFNVKNIPTFDLKTANVEQMQLIYGIGPKLANLWMRFMHPEHQDDFVVIDTHVRRWMRNNLGIDDSKHTYHELASKLRFAAGQRGMTISELDEMIVTNGVRARLARRKQKK